MDTAIVWSVLGSLCMTGVAEASSERSLLTDSSLSADLHGLVSFELSGWNWTTIDALTNDVELVSVGSADAFCEPLTTSELSSAVLEVEESIQLMDFTRSLAVIDRTYANLWCLESTASNEWLSRLYQSAERLEDIAEVSTSFNPERLVEAIEGSAELDVFYGGWWSSGISDDDQGQPQVWIDGVVEPRRVSSGPHLVQLVEPRSRVVINSEFIVVNSDISLLWVEREDANHTLGYRVARDVASPYASPAIRALEEIHGADIYRVVEEDGSAIVRSVDGSTVVTIMGAPERKVFGVGFGFGASGGLVGDPMAAGIGWLRYSPYIGLNLVASIEGGASAELLPPAHPDFWAMREQWTFIAGVRYGAPMGISGWEFGGDIASRRSGDRDSELGYRLAGGAYRSAWKDTGVRTTISVSKWPLNWDLSLNVGLEWSR